MKSYLVRVANGYNVLDNLSRLGQVEYVSGLLNIYLLKTKESIDEIMNIEGVMAVNNEATATLTVSSKYI